MQSTEYFQKTIAAMLDNEAAKDPIFAETLKKEGKNIEECCDYIIGEVEKSGKCGFADEEILGMAKHYWDEDDIEISEHSNCRVVVNREVELSDEDFHGGETVTAHYWQSDLNGGEVQARSSYPPTPMIHMGETENVIRKTLL